MMAERQFTDDLLLSDMLWMANNAMFWLIPANHGDDSFAPILRHWKNGAKVSTRTLPGMQFFDAWRIVSTMSIDPLEDDKFEIFDGELPPREKWEFKTQSVDRTDAQLLREQTLQLVLKTKPAHKWQPRSHKYTSLPLCSLTEQRCSQTWPALDRDTWTMVPATSGDHSTPMETEVTGRDLLQYDESANGS